MEQTLYEKVGGEEAIAKVGTIFTLSWFLRMIQLIIFLKKQIWKNNAVIRQSL